jgi:hypothetical protein
MSGKLCILDSCWRSPSFLLYSADCVISKVNEFVVYSALISVDALIISVGALISVDGTVHLHRVSLFKSGRQASFIVIIRVQCLTGPSQR